MSWTFKGRERYSSGLPGEWGSDRDTYLNEVVAAKKVMAKSGSSKQHKMRESELES